MKRSDILVTVSMSIFLGTLLFLSIDSLAAKRTPEVCGLATSLVSAIGAQDTVETCQTKLIGRFTSRELSTNTHYKIRNK